MDFILFLTILILSNLEEIGQTIFGIKNFKEIQVRFHDILSCYEKYPYFCIVIKTTTFLSVVFQN